jgi:hypothetical protein
VSEVDFAKLEDQHIISVFFYRDVVAKCAVVIPLGLVQDMVVLVDAADEKLLAVVGRCADLTGERVALEFDPVDINVRLAAGIDGVNDVFESRDLLGENHKQQYNELTLQTTRPSCQHSCHFTGAQLIRKRGREAEKSSRDFDPEGDGGVPS